MKEITIWYHGRTYFKKILVDDEDYTRTKAKNWCISGDILKSPTIRESLWREGKPIANFIMNDYDNMYDHINGDTFDEQKENLRIATKHQNAMNRRRTNTSGLRGVYWFPPTNRWQVQLTYLGKRISVGYFIDKLEAGRAYDRAAKKYFGEFAVLNFPEEKKDA